VEVEEKYDTDEGTPLPDLAGLPGVASVALPEEHELEATYVDTPGLALARAGITLRRRTGGNDAGWHLKLPADDGRYEVREPLGDADEPVPDRLSEVLRVVVRDEPLLPAVTVRTRRTAHRLLDEGGRVLVEVADDRVTAWSGDPTAPRRWREWEVELAEGDHDLLEAAAEALVTAGATPSGTTSKLARALGDRFPATPERRALDADTPAGTVVQDRLAEQVAELVRQDPLVRSDAPDAVHQMRVATRRLRSALATFRPFLDREVTEPLRDELKELGRVLGEARDAEVLRETIEETLNAAPPDVPSGEARSHVVSSLTLRYERAHARAVTTMASERYLALVDRLQALATDPPLTAEADQPTNDVLRRRVRHDWKRVRARVRAVAAVEDPAGRSEALHEVRKAAKRARYAAEPLVPAYGQDARRLVKRLKRVQSTLGDQHDGLVARAELPQLARRAASDGVDVYALGELHVRLEDRAAAAEAAFEEDWRRASKKKVRSWLTSPGSGA
jgi:CHAD domain-containing protein